MLDTALHYSHHLLKEIIQPGDHVVDATVGNGHDTRLLAELVGKTGKVYGFDVQAQALKTTQARLAAEDLTSQTELFQRGHEDLASLIPLKEHLRGAIFNLGYLPKSDKSIITTGENTLTALSSLLPRLLPGGRIIIVVYYGHPGGELEKDAVMSFVTDLSQKEYNVLSYQFINQKNNPPILLAIEKKLSSQ